MHGIIFNFYFSTQTACCLGRTPTHTHAHPLKIFFCVVLLLLLRAEGNTS